MNQTLRREFSKFLSLPVEPLLGVRSHQSMSEPMSGGLRPEADAHLVAKTLAIGDASAWSNRRAASVERPFDGNRCGAPLVRDNNQTQANTHAIPEVPAPSARLGKS